MNNTLFLGNGFNLSIYTEQLDWNKLFEGREAVIKGIDNTLKYEACYSGVADDDNTLKGKIGKKIEDFYKVNKVKDDVAYDLERFAEKLIDKKVGNLITTNYDHEIENNILSDKIFKMVEEDKTEKVYSVRRKKRYLSERGSITLWKIHGDVDSPASMVLGYDQYSGFLSKIEGYFKGKYSKKVQKIKDKIVDASYDNMSWIELFFNTNVYIAGFGMDYSERDIWWLLNKRARLIKEGYNITNTVTFLYSKYDEANDDFYKKKEILKAFHVVCQKIDADEKFIASTVNSIK